MKRGRLSETQGGAKRCWICFAGPSGLRAYESSNVSGKWVTKSWVCAEWLVPCHRRNNAFGKKARKGLPTGERGRRCPEQVAHRKRVAARRREEAHRPEPWWDRLRSSKLRQP